jgi:geranylgeranyl pyrophosphate synthase
MVAGQVADMNLCQVPDGAEGVNYIHLHKTADLMRAAARMGAICARADTERLAAVSDYAESLGLAFQLIDDMLDVTGQAELLGKTPGKDQAGRKRTGVEELGLDQAARLADELTGRARKTISILGPTARKLQRLAELLAERGH